MGATNNSIASNFVLGMANLIFPEFEIQRWQTVLVAYLVAFLSAAVNLWGSHLLHRISKAILIWNVASFVIVTATILATNDHKQPASFVFQDFQNGPVSELAWPPLLVFYRPASACAVMTPRHI